MAAAGPRRLPGAEFCFLGCSPCPRHRLGGGPCGASCGHPSTSGSPQHPPGCPQPPARSGGAPPRLNQQEPGDDVLRARPRGRALVHGAGPDGVCAGSAPDAAPGHVGARRPCGCCSGWFSWPCSSGLWPWRGRCGRPSELRLSTPLLPAEAVHDARPGAVAGGVHAMLSQGVPRGCSWGRGVLCGSRRTLRGPLGPPKSPPAPARGVYFKLRSALAVRVSAFLLPSTFSGRPTPKNVSPSHAHLRETQSRPDTDPPQSVSRFLRFRRRAQGLPPCPARTPPAAQMPPRPGLGRGRGDLRGFGVFQPIFAGREGAAL